MSYTASDLITLFRREVDDPAYFPDANFPDAKSFWSNYELLQYLDQAQKEFAERTLVFKDDDSFKPAIVEDDPWVELDPLILRIERAEIESTEVIVPVYTIEEFQTSLYVDDYGIRRTTSWESNAGVIQCFIRDIYQDKLRAYPIPEQDDFLLLTVRRYPLNNITALDQVLEVPERWQFGLLYGMRKEAFRNPKALAAGFGNAVTLAEADWENFLIKAVSREQIRTRGPGKIRYGGI